MLPSPVISTCTDVVADPSGSDAGGNIKIAVSIFLLSSSPGKRAASSESSVCEASAKVGGEKCIGLSMIAIQRATDVTDLADGGDIPICLVKG